MSQPTIICLTPVRNEEWILERFLQCASLWADHIIVADQRSEDSSREIAARFPKVTLIDNPTPGYNEGEYRRILLQQARRIAGDKILIALDADEMLTANWLQHCEWEQVRAAAPGTLIKAQWVNVLPGFERGWIPPSEITIGFVDDGRSPHQSGQFHVGRVPMPPDAPVITLSDIKVLHYQYTDWQRMKSKQRGYECREHLDNPRKRAIQIYRQYHHMDAIAPDEVHPLDPAWLGGYEQTGIDMRTFAGAPYFYWDVAILDMMREYGAARFRKLAIWDVDWNRIATEAGINAPPATFADPRTGFEKRVHAWLERTQARKMSLRVRRVQRILRLLGW